MDLKIMLSYVISSTLFLSCNAFWWSPSSTTEAPVKHIPLGYFRTYTYQPVGAAAPYSFSILGTAANPFNWPTRVPSAPLLPGSRYEMFSAPTTTEQTKPPTTSTTTTTTTSTTSTTEPPPPPPPIPTQPPLQDRVPIPLINSPNSINSGSKYIDQTGTFGQYHGGMYNRRSLPYFQQQSNFFRPYPYPDYSAPNPRSTVQFVPCMCPINFAQPPADMPETRTMPEGDEMVILRSTDNPAENENADENTVLDLEDEAEKKSGRLS